MLISEIIAYHGGGKAVKKLKTPLFVTTSKVDARWFAVNKGDDDGGFIMTGEVAVKNPLDLTKPGEHSLESIATLARIEFEEDPYFFSPAIAEFSNYDGTNSIDLVYVPAFQTQLKKLGYDSIYLMDVMTNYEIETYVLFNANQFKVISSEKASSS